MRLLHTADWHLGARFHDQRRAEEEDDALEQVIALCRERAVDAVIVAGDVFDNANPGAADERRYYRTLARLVRDAGVATVVVVAGNHDSALRLEGPRELARAIGVHVVGRFGRDVPPEEAVVPLVGRDGEVAGVCAALPYLRDGDLRLPEAGESLREIHQRYAEALTTRYAEVRDAARELHPGVPLVVTGHCHVLGGRFGGEERAVQFGGLGAVPADELAGDAAYLALGHLHRPQDVGEIHWRYCGSLLPTGFDETGTHREAVLFELGDAGEAARKIEHLVLRPFRAYRRLAGSVEDVEEQIGELHEPKEGAPTPWCEAVIRLDGPRPGLAPALVDRARERGWSLVSVRIDRCEARPEGETERPLGLHELSPEEVFVARHRAEYGGDPDDELMAEFRSLLEEVYSSSDMASTDMASSDTSSPAQAG